MGFKEDVELELVDILYRTNARPVTAGRIRDLYDERVACEAQEQKKNKHWLFDCCCSGDLPLAALLFFALLVGFLVLINHC